MTTVENQKRKQLADELYERYAKPLEQEYPNKYAAISPEGQVILGDTLLEAAERARDAFGTGGFLFKVGAKAVGKWR